MLTRRSFIASTAATMAATTVLNRRAFGQGGPSEVHVGIIEDPQTLDPANHRNRTTETVIRNMNDGLLTRDPNMKVVPEIAKSWRQVDAKTYEFALNEGIKFHSGDQLTADDIVFTFNRLVHENGMGGITSPRKGLLSSLVDTTKVDDYTVRMHLSDPWPYLADYMPVQEVVNRRHFENVGQEGMQTSVDGCGPFKLNAWRRGEAVIMDRFDDYFGGSPAIPPVGPAMVERLVFRTVPDASARLAGLLSGELDIITNVLPSHVATVEASNRARLMKVAGTTHFYLGTNMGKAPFNDVRVRRALSLAIDRQLIIDRVMGGNATPLRGAMAAEDDGFNPDLPELNYDLEQAKALLAEAEVAPGTSMVIDTIDANKEAAEVVAAMLSQTGLNVRTQVWEGAVLAPTWRNGASRAERDLLFYSMGNSAMTSEILPSALSTGGGLNLVGYSNPEIDALLKKFDLAEGDERTRLAHELQKKSADDVSQIFLWVPNDLYGVSKRLEGWKPRSDSRINLHRVRIVG